MIHELRGWATWKVKSNDAKDRKLENVFLIKIHMSAAAFWAYLEYILINTKNVLCFFLFSWNTNVKVGF